MQWVTFMLSFIEVYLYTSDVVAYVVSACHLDRVCMTTITLRIQNLTLLTEIIIDLTNI